MVSVEVKRSEIHGSVICPPSKSYTHRAVAISSLSPGESAVKNPLLARDTVATINACRTLGSELHDNGFIRINGRSSFSAGEREINAENSGTTIRIATVMSALVESGKTVLTGDESLRKRPMQPLLDALKPLGVECRSLASGTPPVVVKGGGIHGGYAKIMGDVSSQFISGLLISCIYARKDVEIEVTGEQVSKPYIDATLATMKRFGARVENEHYTHYYINPQQYKPARFEVPSDFSSAAMMLAAGAVAGDITVRGLNFDLPQADSKIVDILHDMGASVKLDSANGTVSITAPEKLEGDTFNLNNTPDLLPVVSVLALKAKSKVTIKGVAHTRVKETDRIANIAREFRKLGADIEEFEDGLSIRAAELKSARLDAYNDHRLFMAFCIASLLTERCVIDGLESVDVSYPNFVEDFGRLGASIQKI